MSSLICADLADDEPHDHGEGALGANVVGEDDERFPSSRPTRRLA